MSALAVLHQDASAAAVVGKAVLNAADRLGVRARTLGSVIGLSEPTISRLKRGGHDLDPDGKPFELALLFVRLYRSLDAVVGGDDAVARAWMGTENNALGGRPIDRIRTVEGLVDVLGYLDARRAVV